MSDSSDPVPRTSNLGDVTELLRLAGNGDAEALGAAYEALAAELRQKAGDALQRNPGDGTIQATGLVHEAFIKTASSCSKEDEESKVRWQDRMHFIRSQKETMKNFLVDSARRKGALRRGGGASTIDIVANEESLELTSLADDTLFIEDACEELKKRDPLPGELAELHYFCGLTWEEAGALLGLPERVRRRMSRRADAWFLEQLEGQRKENGPPDQ